MVHDETSYFKGSSQSTKTLTFFYLFELGGILLAEQFSPPTVVFEPLDLPPPRTISRENVIITDILPRSPVVQPRCHNMRAGAKSRVKSTGSRRQLPAEVSLTFSGHKYGGDAFSEPRDLYRAEIAKAPPANLPALESASHRVWQRGKFEAPRRNELVRVFPFRRV
ncbi:unnamed protein product [Rhizoctonia solani]|uniref:Uncharacterized protein n=1 Tax=Rhizoctonia solani TaxID=456999 RepID=A0A8H2XCF3_9AGAM|nr:unnamed protein product [Rhizoctonia solani]